MKHVVCYGENGRYLHLVSSADAKFEDQGYHIHIVYKGKTIAVIYKNGIWGNIQYSERLAIIEE